jgi:glycosyltransferase involved in cell wall biosynthesis
VVDAKGHSAVRRNTDTNQRLLAIIPARNEAATVGEIVRRVRAVVGSEILVVNDASEDETSAQARLAGAKVIDLPFRLGAWGAAQTGLRYAKRNRFTIALTLDADGQHHPEELPALLEGWRSSGAHVAIGTFPQRLSAAKRLAWRYFQALTGIGVQDFTSGLRVYDRRAIKVLASRQASLFDYQDLGVLMLLRKKGLCLHEVPTVMSPRRTGGSRVFSSWPMVARYMLHTTVLCFAQFGVRGRFAAQRAGAQA